MADEDENVKMPDEAEDDMHKEDVEDRDVYKKDYRDHLTEDDELSPEEEGFMEGYDSDEE